MKKTYDPDYPEGISASEIAHREHYGHPYRNRHEIKYARERRWIFAFFALLVWFAILLFWAKPAGAQARDSSDKAILYMSSQIRLSDREWKQGLAFGAGGSLAIIGGCLMKDERHPGDMREPKQNLFKPALIGFGGIACVIAIILEIDSRSQLGKAGRIRAGKDGLIITLK